MGTTDSRDTDTRDTETTVRHIVTAGIGGAIAMNVVPHLAHGVTGKPFPTPFSDPPGRGDSSSAANLVWAAANAGAAAALVCSLRSHLTEAAVAGALAGGAAVAAVGLREYFRRARTYR